MKKVKQEMKGDSGDESQFKLRLKSLKIKTLTKRFLTVLLILFLSGKILSPGKGRIEDPKIIGARYMEIKREIELTEFNLKLKKEHPDLFVLAMRESALTHLGDTVPNYKAYNKLGYLGAWQIHWKYLPSLGVYGVTYEDFLEDPDNTFPFEVQIYAVQQLINKNIKYLGWYYDYYPGKRARGVNITEEGMIYAAHLGGAWGLKKFLKYGNNPKDIYGTSIKDYLDYQNTFRYQL